MAPLSSLEPQHRAVISLVLTKGKTYSEIAGLLDIDLETVRVRAHQALDALGPTDVSRPTPGRRAAISDYLLGQEPGRAPETLAYLEQSVAGRSWARAVAPELAALAGGPLPAVPPEPPAPGEPAASPTAAAIDPPPATELPPPAIDPPPATVLPPPAVDPPPPAVDPPPPTRVPPAAAKRATPRKTPPDPAPASPAADPPVAATTGPEPEPSPTGDAAPPPTPGLAPASPLISRRGGLLLILGALAVLAVVVVIAIVGLGGHSSPGRTTAAKPATTTTPARLIAQITLTPARGERARGFAAVIQRGAERVIAIAASGLRPTSRQLIYGAWLYNTPADFKLVGYVPQIKTDGKVSAAAPLPAGAARFHTFVVTRSTAAASSRPGAIILRGTIPAGAAG